MGEVYRALDTRLNRTVAIKVLKADVAADAGARARFEREARAIAALSHPHICTIHDVGREGDTDYLVMEYLEGETLADRLATAKAPLPLEQVLRIGIAIADALDKAHRAGITHRDLKPANVMLTTTGPKLLDFGLAKLRGAASPVVSVLDPSADAGTTAVGPATAKGTILGTIHYMAPEQVEGREADARSDIWALGALLYEMATGQRPFDGESAASVIGAILKDTPPAIATRQPLTPPAFEHLVERCLEKDPDERWQDVRDVKRELSWIDSRRTRTETNTALATPRRRPVGAWLAAAAVVGAAGLALVGVTRLWTPWRQPVVEARAFQFTLDPPFGAAFVVGNQGGAAISPDGRTIVFVAAVAGTTLWLRPLDSLKARELPGTSGAAYPFWSPDGRAVGFFAEGKLKTIDVAGVSSVVVLAVTGGRGGSWGADGTIAFAPSIGAIQRVAASGGVPSPVTRLNPANGETTHRWPQLLPDGRHLLYFVRSSKPNRMGLYLGTLDHPDEKVFIVESTSSGTYSPPHGNVPGYVLWQRSGALMAQPFDLAQARLSGEPEAVAGGEQIGTMGGLSQAPVWLSREGTLLFSGADDRYQLAWLSRKGTALGTVSTGQYAAIRMSPDGARVALSETDASGNREIWTMDLARGVATRLTHETGNVPVWSPDGRQIAFHDSTTTNLFTVGVDDGRTQNVLASKGLVYINDWSPDGRFLMYTETNPTTGNDLWLLPIAGDRTPAPLLVTAAAESHGQFSPDGRWVSYTSTESGQEDIYIRTLTGKGTTRVSTSGGSFSRWRKDGRELFYRALDGRLMVVPVAGAGDQMTVGTPVPLFKIGEPLGTFAYPFDISSDGQKILALTPTSTAGDRALTVLVNWEAGLRK